MRNVVTRIIGLGLATVFLSAALNVTAAPTKSNTGNKTDKKELNLKKITPADRKAAADKLQQMLVDAGLMALPEPATFGEKFDPDTGYLVPDYFGSPNWAYTSTDVRKFVDELAGLGPDNANLLGQYIPLAVPDQITYTGDDYYEIAVVEYMEKMHTDLPETKNRGYVQIDTALIPGDGVPLKDVAGNQIYFPTEQLRSWWWIIPIIWGRPSCLIPGNPSASNSTTSSQ